jgi:hypothetical protein
MSIELDWTKRWNISTLVRDLIPLRFRVIIVSTLFVAAMGMRREFITVLTGS